MLMNEAYADPEPGDVVRKTRLAVVGDGMRTAALLRLIHETDSVTVASVCTPTDTERAFAYAKDHNILATTDLGEALGAPGLDLIMNLSGDPVATREIDEHRPHGAGIIAGSGADMVWDLLVAKKHGDEQGRLFMELQMAYDRIRDHERQLQVGKAALETANNELERRLAEIFFTHEFFKALTRFASVDDVCSLIVDGCNGILGAQISCVYLFNPDDWTLRLRDCQGCRDEDLNPVVEVSRTVLGRAFREGPVQEAEVDSDSGSADWVRDPRSIASQAVVPLCMGESVFGVVVIASQTYRELDETEFDRFQVLGNQSSLSLQNALLHGELERLSVTDRLTELYNHGHFMQRLDEEFKRASRFGHRLSLIMFDIDDFKSYNDTWGHPQGDDVLREVASVIRDNLREMDVAARYGGEEFVLLLPETDEAGAALVAERIRNEVSERVYAPRVGMTARRTISVGVSNYPGQVQTASALLQSADAAMYRAKRSGKNRVVLASSR